MRRHSYLALPILVFALAALTAGPAGAVPPGGLDPSFAGPSGVAAGQFALPNGFQKPASAHAVAVQPDGKLVLTGPADVVPGDGMNFVFAVWRLLPDGRLDPTFGDEGMATVELSDAAAEGHDIPFALALQDDGKIVVAGETGIDVQSALDRAIAPKTGGRLAVIRLRPDGSLDLGFGKEGVMVPELPPPPGLPASTPSPSGARAVALEPDGDIVVAGYSVHPLLGEQNATVVRMRGSDGALDPTFGNSGVARISWRSNADVVALAVAVEPVKGRIVVAGRASELVAPGIRFEEAGVGRFLPDGTRDPDFDGDGSPGNGAFVLRGQAAFQAIAIQPDGHIVVAGRADTDPRLGPGDVLNAFLLVRLEPERGRRDPGFDGPALDGDGTVVLPMSPPGHIDASAEARAIALQRDGGIVVAGDALTMGALARLHPFDGTLDPRFGAGGRVHLGGFTINAVAIDAQQRIVVTGYGGRPFVARLIGPAMTDGDGEPGGGAPGSGPGGEAPPAAGSEPSPAPPAAPADTRAPQTRITSLRSRVRSARRSRTVRVTLRFRASERGARFRCRVSGRGIPRKLRRAHRCRSPRSYTLRLRRGRSSRRIVFSVQAIDGAGNVDRTPARRALRVRGVAR